MTFELGDLVCPKSGGPLMTVDSLMITGDYSDTVGTFWFEDGQLFRNGFHPSCLNKLVKVEDAPNKEGN